MTSQPDQEGQEPQATQEEKSGYYQQFPELAERAKRRKYV